MTAFALVAHPLVVWLLDCEPDVKAAVQSFCDGNVNGNSLEVAGPPSQADLAKYRKNESKTVGLPCVRLSLSFIEHHLTGERGILVQCSDEHLGELARWKRRSYRRRKSAA